MANLSVMTSAVSGLQAAQAGLLITSQNVSGSSVEGFSRRRSEVVMSAYALNARDLNGTAFAIDGFSRDYSGLLEQQRGKHQGRVSQFDTMIIGSSTLDAVVMDSASSLGKALDTFFASAGALARDPDSVSFKTQFFSDAGKLADRFSGVSDSIKAMRDSAQYGIEATLDNANRLAEQLADINEKLLDSSSSAAQAPSPDLLDRRDQLLMALQKELGGQAVISANGRGNLYVSGNPIVDINGAARLTYENENIYISLSTRTGELGSKMIFDGNASGRARGYFDLLTDFIPELESRIGQIAKNVADTVNGTLDPGGIQPAPANEIFTYLLDEDTGLVRNFSLRDDIDASGSVIKQAEARAIEAIRQSENSPITQWAGFTTFVGGQVSSWKADYEASLNVAQRLDQDREKIAGVNLDEEAANLIKFQQLYGAASKVLQVGSQLFDVLLNALR